MIDFTDEELHVLIRCDLNEKSPDISTRSTYMTAMTKVLQEMKERGLSWRTGGI